MLVLIVDFVFQSKEKTKNLTLTDSMILMMLVV